MRNKCIGLTGNIACGKSTVAKMLRALGATVIDADRLSREVTQPGSSGLRALRKELGDAILAPDGGLDRAKLRDELFKDAEKRKKTEAVLHPLIAAESERQAEAAFQKGESLVFYEAPLLVETGRSKELQGLICVTCAPETQLARLTARDRMDAESAQRMIQAQMPQDQKAKHADWIIENDGTLDDLREKVEGLWRGLRS